MMAWGYSFDLFQIKKKAKGMSEVYAVYHSREAQRLLMRLRHEDSVTKMMVAVWIRDIRQLHAKSKRVGTLKITHDDDDGRVILVREQFVHGKKTCCPCRGAIPYLESHTCDCIQCDRVYLYETSCL